MTPGARTAVVTGAAGFVGSHVVDALARRGWRVRRLARAASPPNVTGDSAGGPRPDAVETHAVDFADPRTLDRTPGLDGLGAADAVVHVGGVTKRASLDAYRAGNVLPTRALLDALARRADGAGQTPRFVYISSQAAAGPAASPGRPVTEDDAPRPVEAYGRSKLEAEEVVRASGPPWTIVRPAIVYGPRDRDTLAVFRQAARGVAVYPGRRDGVISLVYAEDVADAVARAAAAPAAAGRVYFVAAEEGATWRDLYAAAAAGAGRRLRVEVDTAEWALRVGALAGDLFTRLTGRDTLLSSQRVALARPRWWACSAARARAELGWAPRVPLADGARRAAAWYAERGWL